MASSSYQTTASASGFGNRIGWGKHPSLILVDVCKAYWTPGSPLDISSNNPPAVAALEVMRRLLDSARTGKVPVIWTQCRYKADMSDAGLFYLKAKNLDVWAEGDERGLDGWMPGLEPRGEEAVVLKKHASAFFGTELVGKLVEGGVDTVVICGVSTSGCIRATSLDALGYGFRPMVVGTGCGDRSPAIHDANVNDMDAKMADVVSEEEAIGHLERGWL